MGRKHGFVFFFLLLFAVPSCFGQGTVGPGNFSGHVVPALRGYVRDEASQQGILGVRIELVSPEGRTAATAFSGVDGDFHFDDLGVGDCLNGGCNVVIEEEDGYLAVHQTVPPSFGQREVHLNVYLRKEGSMVPGAALPSEGVSAHQLKVPGKARDALEKGMKLLSEKSDFHGAISQFQHAIQKYPDYYEAYSELGVAYVRSGDPAAGEQALRKSTELGGDKYPQAFTLLAELLNNTGRFADAAPVARKGIAANGSSWQAHYELARALYGLKRPAEALPSAIKARELKPDKPEIHLLLGNTHARLRDYSSAIQDLDAYLKLQPSGPTSDQVRRMREQVQKALDAPQGSVAQPALMAGDASLRVTLRLSDTVPFSGAATLRLTTPLGFEIAGKNTGFEGETLFSNIQPGSYVVEASAAGFAPLKQTVEVKSAQGLQTVFLIMRPETPGPLLPKETLLFPRGVDEVVPEVAPNVSCSLPGVLQGAGQRVTELMNNLEKFSAREHVEHFTTDGAGGLHSSDVRSFDYVVLISRTSDGDSRMDEYRNGSPSTSEQFPAGIVTSNLPAQAQVFDPVLVSDFNFRCEGLGQWKGHPTWQVRFEQRQDRPSRFLTYVVDNKPYPVLLKGRAWIEPDSFQVVRLESDLLKPVEEIRLKRQHLTIDYAPVQFRTESQQLWLPQTAELYADLRGRRFYRRHTFSDFKVFTVGTNQVIQSPKESYCFTSKSDREIAGVLSVAPVPGTAFKPTSITLTIPPKGTVCKTVGPAKDVKISAESVGSATFTYDGPPESVRVQAYLTRESAVEVIPNSPVPTTP